MTEHPTATMPSGPRVPSGPRRTCVGCRRAGERSVLLRLVTAEVDGVVTVVLDRGRVLPGRGAWLHLDLDCLQAALRRSAVPRGLRLARSVDLTGLVAEVTALVQAGERRSGTNEDERGQRT